MLFSLPCHSLQLINNTLPESGEGLMKNWKPVVYLFFVFFCFFIFLLSVVSGKSSRSVSTDSQIPSPLQHCRARTDTEELLLVIHMGLKTPTNLCAVVPNRHGHTGPVKFACFVSIDCTDYFFNVICAFFFYSKKKRTPRKKKHKKDWKKIQYKKQFCLALHIIHKASAHSTHTHTHTRILTDLQCSSFARGSSPDKTNKI